MKKLEYIKADGVYYYQRGETNERSDSLSHIMNCDIKKLKKGKYQIDYFSWIVGKSYTSDECFISNKRIVLYPRGIQYISYFID